MKYLNKQNYLVIALVTTLLFSIVSIVRTPLAEERSHGEPLLAVGPLDYLSEEFVVSSLDKSYLLFYAPNHYGYRYGPSIMRHDDGSIDVWYSSPGNNYSEWDYIRYRHSDDGGETWSAEKVVLKPTRGSKDSCSVCDPGVIYFNGWYYLAYTSTGDARRKGYNNSAFVARSNDPDGPFEKWNGDGWGGSPEPIISYEGDPWGWGIGEISFVIKDDDLYVYYTYFDTTGGYTSLKMADLSEDWPKTLEEIGAVNGRTTQDSLDVVYDEQSDHFLAFSIRDRMSSTSQLIMYHSADGIETFRYADFEKKDIEAYAHNLGISKDEQGHIDTSKTQLIGYAYGRGWGRWSLKFQEIKIDYKVSYY